MRWAVLLTFPLAVASAAPSRPAPLSDEERSFCASEVDVVERRQRVFEGQGLSGAEVDRKNEAQLQELADCRERWRAQARRTSERDEDLAEVTRRAGKDATELERERVWKEIRRERLSAKRPSTLTPEEKAELAAGAADELAATHEALDRAHAQDPRFMRVVHSALSCFHGGRRADVLDQISSEEAMLKLGSGDRQKLYALKSQLRESEAVLARSLEATREYPGGLERCSVMEIAVLARCLALRADGRNEEACGSESIQQYIRLVK